jgi:hypothetical protein
VAFPFHRSKTPHPTSAPPASARAQRADDHGRRRPPPPSAPPGSDAGATDSGVDDVVLQGTYETRRTQQQFLCFCAAAPGCSTLHPAPCYRRAVTAAGVLPGVRRGRLCASSVPSMLRLYASEVKAAPFIGSGVCRVQSSLPVRHGCVPDSDDAFLGMRSASTAATGSPPGDVPSP